MTDHAPADPFATALTSLVEDGTLTAPQASRVNERLRPLLAARTPAPAPARHTRTVLVEFAGYLGGALFLGGISLVTVPSWDRLAQPARLALALAVTLVLIVAALVADPPWRREEDRPAARGRLASTLGALAAGGAAVTAAVIAPTNVELLTGSIAALVVAGAGYLLLRGAPLLVAAYAASAMTLGSALEEAGVQEQAGWATAFALLGGGWLALGIGRLVREAPVAGLLGGLTGLGAGETAAVGSDAVAAYGLVLGLAVIGVCFGAYLAARSWPLLVPAVLTALVVPPTALANVLESGLAAGIAVAAVGAVILAGGGVALAARRPAPR